MNRYKLSILIPARNEFYHDIDLLHETVTNVLANTSNQCEVVCVLDGYDSQWPIQPLPINPRLTIIQHRKSIGQRAATNEAARVAQGEWVCKLDAHCAIDSDFDTKLLMDAQPHWTIVPGQFNLLVFEWKCKKCSWTKDQSPKPLKCEKCGSRYLKQVKIWKPRDGREGRRNAYTHSWRFDSNLDFAYWGQFTSDEAHCKKHNIPFRPEAQGQVHDTMSLLGACWAMTRERYFYLEPCDEAFGSWGDMGTEIACKTWLSGGELKVNQNTWFAHFFRVGGIGFPYQDGGRKERAKARGKELWLKNQWPKQVYPLSWLIEKFKPLPDWHSGNNPVLAQVIKAGKAFCFVAPLSNTVTDSAKSSAGLLSVPAGRVEGMTSQAVCFTSIDNPDVSRVPFNIVPVVGNENNMSGIAARGVLADNMIQHGNVACAPTRQGSDEPSVHIPMGQFDVPAIAIGDMPVPVTISGAVPDPAVQRSGSGNSGKDTPQLLHCRSLDDKGSASHGLTITNTATVGYLYYTCNSHDELLELAMRANLLRSKNGNEIGCVSLKRTDFGDWSIVLDRQKSGATMHYQILAGLERMRSEYVFLCESDVAYHGSHFEFVPPDPEVFFYNTNVWRVRYSDGHAVRTANLQQVSGICASRKLLLEHYRRRVELINRNGGVFDVKRMAYEPGTRGRLGDERIANWQSPYPNIDITGHGQTLTTPHFSIDSFRNKKYAAGWEETDDAIPGWGKLSGRIQEFLNQLANG